MAMRVIASSRSQAVRPVGKEESGVEAEAPDHLDGPWYRPEGDLP